MYVHTYVAHTLRKNKMSGCKCICFESPWPRPLLPAEGSICSPFPSRTAQMAAPQVLPDEEHRAVQRPCVHRQDSETSMELSGKEMENKIKWGLIRKANVCRDKATAGIVISQIVLIWANSASETVTMVFMLSSPSWPYLASLAPLSMGQTLITLHQRSLPRHHNYENLELVHESDKDDWNVTLLLSLNKCGRNDNATEHPGPQRADPTPSQGHAARRAVWSPSTSQVVSKCEKLSRQRKGWKMKPHLSAKG